MRTLFGYHLFALSLALATSARTEAQQVFGDLHVVANSLDGALDVWPMDVDEDGDQDLLLYNSFRHALTWCSNKGSGTFSPAQWIDTTLSTYAFGTVADMDGDGHLDPVVVSDDGRLSYIPRINGTTFGPPVVFATGLGTTVKDIVSVDLDDDGDTDIVASLGTSGPFGSAYWLNDGMGDLGSPHVLLQPADGIGLIVADLNNDGLPDVCTVTNGVLVRYLNQGNGTFGAADFIFNDSALIAGLAVEANGDGIEDILLLLDTGDILLGLNDGSSTYLNYTTVASGFTHFHFWNAADLNGDGRDDLCITSFDLPVQVNVLLNAGNGSWPTVTPRQCAWAKRR